MRSIVESKLNSQYFQHIVLNDSSCVVTLFLFRVVKYTCVVPNMTWFRVIKNYVKLITMLQQIMQTVSRFALGKSNYC